MSINPDYAALTFDITYKQVYAMFTSDRSQTGILVDSIKTQARQNLLLVESINTVYAGHTFNRNVNVCLFMFDRNCTARLDLIYFSQKV